MSHATLLVTRRPFPLSQLRVIGGASKMKRANLRFDARLRKDDRSIVPAATNFAAAVMNYATATTNLAPAVTNSAKTRTNPARTIASAERTVTNLAPAATSPGKANANPAKAATSFVWLSEPTR